MTKYIKRVTVITTSTYRHKKYYVFPLDGEKDFCYRSRVSFNAFFYSLKDRNDNKTKKLRYIVTDEGVDRWLSNSAKTYYVKSVWEFYKRIGYDFKKKKFKCL